MSIIQQYLTEENAYNRRGIARNLKALQMPYPVFAGLFRMMRALQSVPDAPRQQVARQIAQRYAQYDALPDERHSTPEPSGNRVLPLSGVANSIYGTPGIRAGDTVRIAGRTRLYVVESVCGTFAMLNISTTTHPMLAGYRLSKLELIDNVAQENAA